MTGSARMVSPWLAAWPAMAVAALAAGCTRPLPAEPSSAALYRDVERLVGIQDAAGWQVDRLEIEAMLPAVLMSVCRVEPDRREALLGWLDGRIEALGGPVDRAYRERGRDLGEVSELLELTRIRDTLAAATAAAPADCPFWLKPEPRFAGRQISDDRWQISLGGGGKGNLVSQGGTRDLQFGGAGRVLLGRNFGPRLALYLGLEIGGSAGFPRGEEGDRENLVLNVDGVVPVVARYRGVNAYFEVEAGYLARATEEDWTDPSHGFHVGLAAGARGPRVRWFFPGAVFGVSYEQVFEPGVTLHSIKMGFRVAVDIDL